MTGGAKHSQLQLRVSKEQKSALRLAARRAGMGMSAYVLSRVFPAPLAAFQGSVGALAGPRDPSFALAEVHSMLSRLGAEELRQAVAESPRMALTPFLANYLAAMVETACERHRLPVPTWTRGIAPLADPSFGSSLPSLRLYLLTRSPAAFRRRNIFIDSTLGEQV